MTLKPGKITRKEVIILEFDYTPPPDHDPFDLEWSLDQEVIKELNQNLPKEIETFFPNRELWHITNIEPQGLIYAAVNDVFKIRVTFEKPRPTLIEWGNKEVDSG